jgi:2EXR family
MSASQQVFSGTSLTPIREMIPSHQKYRPADPHQRDDNAPSETPPKVVPGLTGMLSLNIFSRHKKLGRCKSNCRSIEVTVLYPSVSPASSKDYLTPIPENTRSQNLKNWSQSLEIDTCTNSTNLEFMAAAQEPADPLGADPSHDTTSPPSQPQQEIFRFLDLPLELRLKIYSYLLPPRTHTITTQIPHNGYFYNTSTIPLHSASSFYPFGTSPPKSPKSLTTYKVLNRNFRNDFPELTLHVQFLRVCKQVKEEAEPVLYGSKGVGWEFGISLEAVSAFWGDRSAVARQCVRNIGVAREVPDVEGGKDGGVDYAWEKFCRFVGEELTDLRCLNLMVWASSGSTVSFSSGNEGQEGEGEEERKEVERKWKEWEWISGLLGMESLRKARVTWWGFQGGEGQEGRGNGFDSWLARRMVGDKVVRDKMVREGVVIEGSVVLTGGHS